MLWLNSTLLETMSYMGDNIESRTRDSEGDKKSLEDVLSKLMAFVLVFGMFIAIGILFFKDFISLLMNDKPFVIILFVVVTYFLILGFGTLVNNRLSLALATFRTTPALSADAIVAIVGASFMSALYGVVLIALWIFLPCWMTAALFASGVVVYYGTISLISLPVVPVGVILCLALVFVVSAASVFFAIFRLFFPKRIEDDGIVINRNEHVNLWRVIDDVAKKIGAQKIDKIIITYEPIIGVYQDANFIFSIRNINRRVLKVGLPIVHNLTVGEFEAILAHEYGHFINSDTKWNSFTCSLGRSIADALRSMPGPHSNIFDKANNEHSSGTVIYYLVAFLNPAYWVLEMFARLFFEVTSNYSRFTEILADLRSVSIYGGKAFSDGLLKTAINGELYLNYFSDLLSSTLNITEFMESVHCKVAPLEGKMKTMLMSQRQGIYDSHPDLATRLGYASRFEGVSLEKVDNIPICMIFDDWKKLSHVVTKCFLRKCKV